MRILMLNYEFPPLGGGAGNANYYLLKELSRYGDLKIDLLTSSAGKYRCEQFSENIRVHFLDIHKDGGNLHYQGYRDLLIYSWKACRYAQKLNRSEKYDLCHAFFGIPCGFIAMRLRLPYIVSLRGSDVPFYNRRFYWLDKLFFQRLSRKIWPRAHKVVANSAGLKELALTTSPGLMIDVVCNGVDLQEFNPSGENINGADEKLKLISVGRLIERKGYGYLIEALTGLPGVELELIGEGNLKCELEDLAVQSGVKVRFSGNVEHSRLAMHLRRADLFVLPSLNEGMSNALLEAMACGLPVIATDTGGSTELIKGNGYIVRKGDARDLKRVVEIFNGDRDLIKAMGKASREMAEEMSWDKAAAAYYDIYRGLDNFAGHEHKAASRKVCKCESNLSAGGSFVES